MDLCELVSPRKTQRGMYLHLFVVIQFPKTIFEGVVISQKLVFAVQQQNMSLIPEVKAGESLRSRPACFWEVDATQRKPVLKIKVYFMHLCEKPSAVLASACVWNLRSMQCQVVSEVCAVSTTIALYTPRNQMW